MLLTNSEIMDINQNAEFDSAIGYARKIESAVLEKLKAQSVKSPDNGKWNTGIASDGRVFLQSDDFNHDVRLYVNGDFDGNTTDYADRLAAFMNSHPLPPADVVRDAERYRWLRDNHNHWSWNPSQYNKDIVSGFAYKDTGFAGYYLQEAIDAAMKDKA